MRKGVLNSEQVTEILADQSERTPLSVMASLGFASEEQIALMLAENYGAPFIDLPDIEPDMNAVLRIPMETLRRHNIFPFSISETSLDVAMVDPSDIVARDDARTTSRLSLNIFTSTESDIVRAIERAAASQTDLSVLQEEDEAEGIEEEEESDQDTAVARLMTKVISDAILLNAGDIYIEPRQNEMSVRFRIDGVCRTIFVAPKSLYRQFINRLKIQSELDISEKRRPQDGRFGVTMHGKVVDFRVAVLPTIYGELAVLRLLRRDSIMLSLTDLGFLDYNFKLFNDALKLPYGMILVTGPTGSGKSTTLYAAINETTTPTTNLITVEDPVEYRLEGLSQVQVHEKAGMTFAAALRSILRQDPDQVMIGEIRDSETGKIAIEASLTGHLVLSTLHTNDAPSALTRLTEMGIEPFLTSSAITLVVAQRLARRLCPECKEAYVLDEPSARSVGFPFDPANPPTLYRAVGCKHCNDVGYKGRMGIHEVMATNEEIERLIVKNATADEIRRAAIKNGMKTLRDDGFAKVLEGLTSIEEILRVVA